MNIIELLKKEDKNFEDYFISEIGYYFVDKNLIFIEGISKHFNNQIWLDNIETLNELNNILDPKNIIGLKEKFVISEYQRLEKHHLLI